VLLYYITDRHRFSGDILSKISEAVTAGVDYIQLREKDLSTRELEALALRTENQELLTRNSKSSLLISSRPDVAMAVGAQGVHLPANEISPREVRRIWPGSTPAVIGVSCHSEDEVSRAAAEGADFAVFGPVFEKGNTKPQGLDRLEAACRHGIPVLALGGVTLSNACSCIAAGAAGIAAIRLFQENNLADVVAALRDLS
jgi:thiamine-phosphate pyrophosphorylase